MLLVLLCYIELLKEGVRHIPPPLPLDLSRLAVPLDCPERPVVDPDPREDARLTMLSTFAGATSGTTAAVDGNIGPLLHT